MIEPGLFDRIIRGEHVDLKIVCKDEKKIDELLGWLKQFNQAHCNGHTLVGCSRFILQSGYRLEVSIGTVPHGPREMFAGTLNSLGQPGNSPFTITTQ